MIRIAFRYGDRRWLARLICWWRGGDASHCEVALQVNGSVHDCVSSSWLDGGVRRRLIDLDPGKWRVYSVPGDWQFVETWYSANKGKKYDLRGFVSGVDPRAGQSRDKFMCHEVAATQLLLPEPHLFFPRELEAVCRRFGVQVQ